VEVAERKIPGTQYWLDMTPLAGTNSVSLQDLLSDGANSHITVQPCAQSGAEGATTAAAEPNSGAVPRL
jgi:hypothetical protein